MHINAGKIRQHGCVTREVIFFEVGTLNLHQTRDPQGEGRQNATTSLKFGGNSIMRLAARIFSLHQSHTRPLGGEEEKFADNIVSMFLFLWVFKKISSFLFIVFRDSRNTKAQCKPAWPNTIGKGTSELT